MRGILVLAVVLLAGCQSAVPDGPSVSPPHVSSPTNPPAPPSPGFTPGQPPIAAPPPSPTPTSSASEPLAFAPSVVAFTCSTSCGEATAAVDGEGRIAVMVAGGNDGIAISEDGGATFAMVPLPPYPTSTTEAGTLLFDATLQAAPDGSLWMIALTRPYSPLVGAAGTWNQGLQVASTRDGAKTWDTNVALGLYGAPGELVTQTDRPWLAFTPQGITVTYSMTTATAAGALFTGIWAVTSQDGKTFSEPIQIAGSLQTGARSSAMPRVDGDAVLVPFVAFDEVAGPTSSSSLDVATWTPESTRIVEAARTTPVAGWLAALDVEGQRQVVACYDAGDLLLAQSEDAGAHWTVVDLGVGGMSVGPFLDLGPLGLDVVVHTWNSTQGEDVVFLRQTHDGTLQTYAVATGVSTPFGRTSDFPWMTRFSDGRALVTWTSDRDVMLAWET